MNRWEVVSKHLETIGTFRTPAEVVEKIKEMQEHRKGKNAAPKTEPKPDPKPEPAKPAAEEFAPPPRAEEAAEDVWSMEQQRSLEAALVAVPATVAANERWAQIAELVPGKTKKQCVARFKEIREKIKAKK